MSCLYILEINPLSVALFANIFFHSVGCLFVYGFLCCPKAFKFNQLPFFVCFYFHYSRRWIQKDIVAIYVREFCYVFLRILQNLVFHRGLQSIFSLYMHMVLECVIIHLLPVAVQFSQHHLLKRLSFLHCIVLPPLSQTDYLCMGLFLGFLSCSIGLHFCFCASTTLS